MGTKLKMAIIAPSRRCVLKWMVTWWVTGVSLVVSRSTIYFQYFYRWALHDNFNFLFVWFEIKKWNFICHIELLIIVCDQCGQGVSGACSVMTREVGRPSEMRCCHEECAGGCSGGQSNQCDVCKHVIHNDECRSVCPPGHYLVRILPLTSSKKLSLLSPLRWTCSSFQVRSMRIWSTDVAIFNYRFLLNYIRFNQKHKSRSFLCLHRHIFTEIGSSPFFIEIKQICFICIPCV